MWNCFLMLGFVSAHIPWNNISNLEIQRSYKPLWCDLVLPSATAHSNIWRREYSLTMDAILKQLPSQNKVSLALNRWTSTIELDIMSIIGYYMECNRASGQVQLTSNEVNCPFLLFFGNWLRMTDQRPTYWSKASHTFEGCSLFPDDRLPFAWIYDR